MTSIRQLRLCAIPIVLGIALGACGDAKTQTTSSSKGRADTLVQKVKATKATQTTFAGKVDDTDAYVVVVQQGNDVVAYSCDGKSIALWMKGSSTGDTIGAANSSGATLAAKKTSNDLIGNIVIAGASRTFTATAAAYPAGLWETFGDEPNLDAHYGWIVLNDGTQRGAKVQQNTVSGAGDVNIDSNSGDGVAAGGPPPPPTPPVTTKLSATQCQSLQRLYGLQEKAWLGAEVDSKKEIGYAVKMVATEGQYDKGGCTGTLGEFVGGGKINP